MLPFHHPGNALHVNAKVISHLNSALRKRNIVAMVIGMVMVFMLCFYWSESSSPTLRTFDSRSTSLMSVSPANAPAINQATSLAERDIPTIDQQTISTMLEKAYAHPRKRKMFDLTKNPRENNLQVLVNAWTEGSFSPVHKHLKFDEVFIILEGSVAIFTFDEDGKVPTCHILTAESTPGTKNESSEGKRAIVVPKGHFHAITAAPKHMVRRINFAARPRVSNIFHKHTKHSPMLTPDIHALEAARVTS